MREYELVPEPIDPLQALEETTEMFMMNPLSVTVDVNDLIRDYGEEKMFEIVGKLKDLLA